MPKASRDTTDDVVEVEGYEGRMTDFGPYTVAFESYSADADLSPFFEGLPDNRCQAEHFGYVFEGKVTFKFADHDETYEAGDAYYAPPGHTPVLYEGTRIVEFSPSRELQQTMEVVEQNMTAATS